MRLTVNGKVMHLEREMSISEFLRWRGLAAALVAVEHNRNWTNREEWAGITLREGDRLEVVRIMAGG